jgi:hypothetical protein
MLDIAVRPQQFAELTISCDAGHSSSHCNHNPEAAYWSITRPAKPPFSSDPISSHTTQIHLVTIVRPRQVSLEGLDIAEADLIQIAM